MPLRAPTRDSATNGAMPVTLHRCDQEFDEVRRLGLGKRARNALRAHIRHRPKKKK